MELDPTLYVIEVKLLGGGLWNLSLEAKHMPYDIRGASSKTFLAASRVLKLNIIALIPRSYAFTSFSKPQALARISSLYFHSGAYL